MVLGLAEVLANLARPAITLYRSFGGIHNECEAEKHCQDEGVILLAEA